MRICETMDDGGRNMNMHVTDVAIACLKDEWAFESGEYVRVYVRYVSGGPAPMALGIQKEKPRQAFYSTEAGGITFYAEESDAWYLRGRTVTIDAEGTEIVFRADVL